MPLKFFIGDDPGTSGSLLEINLRFYNFLLGILGFQISSKGSIIEFWNLLLVMCSTIFQKYGICISILILTEVDCFYIRILCKYEGSVYTEEKNGFLYNRYLCTCYSFGVSFLVLLLDQSGRSSCPYHSRCYHYTQYNPASWNY